METLKDFLTAWILLLSIIGGIFAVAIGAAWLASVHPTFFVIAIIFGFTGFIALMFALDERKERP